MGLLRVTSNVPGNGFVELTAIGLALGARTTGKKLGGITNFAGKLDGEGGILGAIEEKFDGSGTGLLLN